MENVSQDSKTEKNLQKIVPFLGGTERDLLIL